MNPDIAQAIVETGQSLGLDLELYEDYSGRGMYGSTTTGIVGSITDIIQAVAGAAADVENMSDELSGLSMDSMGLSSIVY